MRHLAATTGSINADIACPKCGYALRGLAGPVLTCPECGAQIDLPAILATQRRDWRQSQAYEEISRPGLVVQVGLTLALVSGVIVCLVESGWPMLLVLVGTVALSLGLAGAALRREPTRETLVLLVLQYIVSLGWPLLWIGAIAGCGLTVVFTHELDAVQGAFSLLFGWGLCILGLWWGTRSLNRLDGWIVRRCLARELRRQVAAGLVQEKRDEP